MRRVLMLHYYFPPLGGMGSVRVVKIASQLPQVGWMPMVVSPRSGPDVYDPSLVAPEACVVRTAQLRLRRAGAGLVPPAVARAPGRGHPAAGVRALVHRWLYRPDPQIGWYPFALRAARRALREHPADAIFSSSCPITAHLVARALHRETRLPWIAEFRDLWTDASPHDGRRLEAVVALERALIRQATGVVTVSDTWMDLFQSRGARRVWTLTNGFDPREFAAEIAPRRLTATYVGTYYPDRQDMHTAIAALGALARERPYSSLTLRFVGELPPALPAALATHGLGARVDYTGFVPHTDCVREMMASTVLLVPGPVTDERPELRGNIAGKTFECLATRRPILFVGAPDSDAARLLRPFARVRIVAPGDVEGAKAALRSILADPAPPSGEDLEPFTHRALAARLARILSTACTDQRDSVW